LLLALDSHALAHHSFERAFIGFVPFQQLLKQFAVGGKGEERAELLLDSVNAITSGSTESQGEVTVRLQRAGRVVNGVGSDPDIVVASARAYLAALNKLHSTAERVAAQG
jgi:2-isopropylmalate synthase